MNVLMINGSSHARGNIDLAFVAPASNRGRF